MLRLRETAIISMLIVAVGAALTLASLVYTATLVTNHAYDQARAAADAVYYAVEQCVQRNPTADPATAIAGDAAVRAAVETATARTWPVSSAELEDSAGRSLVRAGSPSGTANGGSATAAPGATAGGAPSGDLAGLREANGVSKLLRILTAGGQFEYVAPIDVARAGRGSESLGRVRVGVAAADLWPAFVWPIVSGVLVVLVSLAGAAVVAALIADFAMRPIANLTASIERMGTNDVGMLRQVTRELPALAAAGSDPVMRATSQLRALGERLAGDRTELELTRGRLQQVMRSIEDRLLLLTPDLGIMAASPHVNALLGLGDRELGGAMLPELLGAGHPVVAIAAEALRTGGAVEQRAIGLASGRQILVSAQYVGDDEGAPIGALVLLRDAESMRRLEEHVDYARKLAQLGRITAGVSHEIKNPLNAMAIHLEILRSKLDAGGDPAPQLEVLQTEIARLDRVVKTFLDYTRPVEVRLEPSDVNRIVEQVARLASAEADRLGVRLMMQLGPGPLVVRTDADLLTQALLNITINGCQAMPDGGSLRIATSRAEGRTIRVAIEDRGIGITPEAREKIYNLYYTTKPGGSGIGLAQAFRAVQIHNGRIELSSEPGRGTTFDIYLPEG